MILPTSSHNPPKKIKEAPKADLRQEITAWRLLVWAYRDEAVRAASNGGPVDASGNGFALQRFGETGIGGGAINGWLAAHEDALTVDAFVWEWLERSPTRYLYVARAAEKARPICPAEALPAWRAVPRCRDNGRPELIYPLTGRHEPIGCLIDFEGVPPEARQRHHELHCLFLAMLAALAGRRFTRWRVTGPGLDSAGRIIDKGANDHALRPDGGNTARAQAV